MEEIEIKPTTPLTQTDLDLLENLVSSPVWSVFRKVVSNGTAQWASALSVNDNFNDMLRLQGRIQGANYMVAYIPMFLKQMQEQKVKPFPKRAAPRPPSNSPEPA